MVSPAKELLNSDQHGAVDSVDEGSMMYVVLFITKSFTDEAP